MFKEFGMDAVDAMKQAHESTLAANKHSQDQAHQIIQRIITILERELRQEGLSWDQKRDIIEQIQIVGKMTLQKDSENKQFLDRTLTKILAGAGAVVVLGVVFVGGKVMTESKDHPEGSLEA